MLAILSSDIVSSRDFWCPLGEDIYGNRVQNLSQASTATHQIRCTRGHTSDAGHMHAHIEMDVEMSPLLPPLPWPSQAAVNQVTASATMTPLLLSGHC